MNRSTENHDSFFENYGIRILISIRRIIRSVDIYSRKLNNEHKVTAPQMLCLYSLAQKGSMMLSDLAKQVNLGVSTVNGIVDRLELKELAKRRRGNEDRRKVFVEITDKGIELTQSAPLLLQDKLSEALRGLPELEQAAIALSLERIVDLMGAGQLDASPNLLPNAHVQESK